MMKTKYNHRKLKLFFSAIALIIIIVTSLSANLAIGLLHRFFSFSYALPDIFWVIVTSLIFGTVFTKIFARFYLSPILKLIDAMREVAKGDFNVKLDKAIGIKEVVDIYDDFNTMTKELKSTEILKTDFISNVSHEFKTPINAISGYATLLQDPELTENERNDYIDKILLNSTRLSNLVQNILLLSKVDNQGINTNLSTYRLDEQIRQSILYLEPKWVAKNNDFDVELEEITYTGNETLLNHVFNNLIENAIKYGPEAGLITIKLIKRNDEIIFTVEDEGPGIKEEALKHIFDRFYQVDNSRTNEGYGLGLALVKQIIDTLDAKIEVSNLEPHGSC